MRKNRLLNPSRGELLGGMVILTVVAGVVMMRGGVPASTIANTAQPAVGPTALSDAALDEPIPVDETGTIPDVNEER